MGNKSSIQLVEALLFLENGPVNIRYIAKSHRRIERDNYRGYIDSKTKSAGP